MIPNPLGPVVKKRGTHGCPHSTVIWVQVGEGHRAKNIRYTVFCEIDHKNFDVKVRGKSLHRAYDGTQWT